jgi:hypothetical protein
MELHLTSLYKPLLLRHENLYLYPLALYKCNTVKMSKMRISDCVTEKNQTLTITEKCGKSDFEKKVLSKIDGLEWRM